LAEAGDETLFRREYLTLNPALPTDRWGFPHWLAMN
jgi:hypothetical protein